MTISDISLAIFGDVRAEADALGRHLAMALQLTNICRDVGEDVGRGRIYLPLDELARFGVVEARSLSGTVDTDGYRALMAFQCDRAVVLRGGEPAAGLTRGRRAPGGAGHGRGLPARP